MAICNSESVYTFSFTTDWFHTVNATAPAATAAPAAAYRAHRSVNIRRVVACATRNQKPAESALAAAARRFTCKAKPPGRGSEPMTCATRMKSGFPGGCGSPSTLAAARYSLVSHIAVPGAMVIA
jgi:hypothetical protein